MATPRSSAAPPKRPSLTKKRSFSFRRTWSNRSNCSNCSEGGDFASSHPSVHASLPLVIHAIPSCHSISETSPIKSPIAAAAAARGLVGQLLADDNNGFRTDRGDNKPNVCILDRDQIVAGEKLGQGSFCIVQEAMFLHTEEDDEDEKVESSNKVHQVPKLVDADDTCCNPTALLGLRDSSTAMFTLSARSDASNLGVLPSPYLPGEFVSDHQSPNILSSGDHSTTVARYCIKHLRSDIDGTHTIRGQRDLLVECSVLKSLHHPHVIAAAGMSRTIQKLLEEYSDRGVSHIPNQNLERQVVDDFFLIEERLTGTLRPRLKRWKSGILEAGCPLPHLRLVSDDLVQSQHGLSLPPIPKATTAATNDIPQAPASTGMISSFLRRRISKQKYPSTPAASQSNDADFWIDRLGVMRNVASALNYLHENAMVYRDLKPDNIGFARDGTLKLFDFGMAKLLQPEDRCHIQRYNSKSKGIATSDRGEILYRLTGCTGSPRYMAPEVASNDPYNRKVDSYSFAVLMWQICALTIPFKGYSFTEHYELMAVERKRPTLSFTESWPKGLSQLIYLCWSHDIAKRPSFDIICQDLQNIQTAHMELFGITQRPKN